jgi:hypothetical protein
LQPIVTLLFAPQKLFPKIFPVCLISYLTIKMLPIYLLHTQQGNNETQTGKNTMIATATNPELRKSESTGGFNTASGGNRKYIASRACWSVFYTDPTGYRAELCMKRKCDAVAVYEWMVSIGWDGQGDYEGQFRSWAIKNRHPVAYSFKGEL